jgi:2-(1,2-epoxy-1,2-dihydrophenyl)acetyl-CoA isomerase
MGDVRVERRGRVLLCTFDRRPAINASTPAMISGWVRALVEAADDTDVGAIVTSAAGRAWCAGADLNFLLRHQVGIDGVAGRRLDALGEELIDGLPTADEATRQLGMNRLATYLLDYPKPLIAAIDGAMAGGGCPLALLHDVRFVGAGASFRTSFVDLGLTSELGLGYLLPRAVGTGRALDLHLTGRAVRGRELVELGLAEYFSDDGDVEGAAIAYAESLAAKPAAGIATVRRLIRREAELPITTYLQREWAAQAAAFESPVAVESVARIAASLGVGEPA